MHLCCICYNHHHYVLAPLSVNVDGDPQPTDSSGSSPLTDMGKTHPLLLPSNHCYPIAIGDEDKSTSDELADQSNLVTMTTTHDFPSPAPNVNSGDDSMDEESLVTAHAQ